MASASPNLNPSVPENLPPPGAPALSESQPGPTASPLRPAAAPVVPSSGAPGQPTAPAVQPANPATTAPAPAPAAPGAPAPEVKEKTLKDRIRELRQNKKFMRIARPASVVLAIAATYWIYTLIFYVSTDDAYITADQHIISSHILGRVVKVNVSDNQIVKKGEVLVQLDRRDYDVQLKTAQANLIKAQVTFARWPKDTAHLDTQDRLMYASEQAALLTAEANLQNAQLQMEYTDIIAPEDGKVGARTVTSGEMVLPSQQLMALMEQKPWIVANFKENQLKKLRPGQKVEIDVDAISGHTFRGRVDSVSPGSGATFSLLPPDNATGNFTKIVQRVPVKIVFDPESMKGYEDRLAPGMSVESSVRVHW